jgi:ABC-2 type transport system permease protein
MHQFWTQVRKEIHEHWATRKILIFLGVMLGIGFLSPISAKLTPQLLAALSEEQNITIILPDPTTSDALAQYIKNTSQLAMIVVLLLGAIAIVSERERGLMTLIFPHALSRTVFVLAKFVGLATLVFAGIFVEALATYIYTSLLFTAPNPGEFVTISLLLYLYLLALVALALLASTLGQTTIVAASITFLFVVVLTVLGIFVDFTPGKLLEWAATLSVSLPMQAPLSALVAALLIIVISVLASCYVLQQQEIVSATGS